MEIKELLEESLELESIGQTSQFIWFATHIGIAALSKNIENEKSSELIKKAINEGKELNLDLIREEVEVHLLKKGLSIVFYS